MLGCMLMVIGCCAFEPSFAAAFAAFARWVSRVRVTLELFGTLPSCILAAVVRGFLFDIWIMLLEPETTLTDVVFGLP